MKSYFWVSVVDREPDTFVAAACIKANSQQGALDKLAGLGISDWRKYDIVVIPMTGEAKHEFKGHMNRLLTIPELRSLDCRPIKEWEQEERT